MLTRRIIILWGLPILIASIIIYFLFEELDFQRQERTYQELRQKGWTLHLAHKKGDSYTFCGGGKIIVDKKQRVWITMPCRADGIYVYDEAKWEIRKTGLYTDLALDTLGRIWAIHSNTVIYFDGEAWFPSYGTKEIITDNGIFIAVDNYWQPLANEKENLARVVDKQGRLWTWNDSEVNVLDKTGWITLTAENSGLAGEDIYALATDASGRIWIANEEGVSMFAGGDIQPVPLELIDQRRKMVEWRESTNGYNWFFPSALGLLWLATYLDVLPGALSAFALGLLLTLILGPASLHTRSSIQTINPGVIATYSGMIAGIIAGRVNNARGKPRISVWAIKIAIIWAIVGFGIAFFLLFILSMG